MLLWDTSGVASHIFTEPLTRFLYYLALAVHHPSEVCRIHPLPSKLLCSQYPIFSLHVFLRLVSCPEAALSILQVAHHRNKLGGLFLLSVLRLR